MCKHQRISHKARLYSVCERFASVYTEIKSPERKFIPYNSYFVHLNVLLCFLFRQDSPPTCGRADSVEEIRCGALLFVVIHVIYKYKNR